MSDALPGQQIQTARLSRGLNHAHAALHLGIPSSVLLAWERGERVLLPTSLASILRRLHEPLEPWLMRQIMEDDDG